MPLQKVRSCALSTASPDDLWASVRDFCAPWHPLVERMAVEKTPKAGLVRSFKVHNEDTTYRERLSYFSDSDRVMAYEHVAGIQGVENYQAMLCVSPTPEGAEVCMTADITAPAPRLTGIANGTQEVFDVGTQAIAAMQAGGRKPFTTAAGSDQPDTEVVKIGGTPRLALSARGQRSDTLCLFLHGIGGNRSNWDEQLAALAPHLRVAALDLRGYGDSALGPEQSTIDDYCGDILRVMQGFGASKLILCGLSYGAWIATSFAMRYPDKLAALVLSGGCTGMSEAPEAERNAFRESRETPMRKGMTPADFAPAVVDIIAGPNATPQDRAVMLDSMQKIASPTYADALRCFTNPTERFDFSKLSLPALLMTGEHDRLAPPTEIRGVAKRIWEDANEPDVRFEEISGAGHICNLEKPTEYNGVLSEFVMRVLA